MLKPAASAGSAGLAALWRRAPGWLTPELAVLGLLALFTRLIWIGRPRAIVFDEVYFREFALRYHERSYFFDIHPPLGKLLLAGWAQLIGIDAASTGTEPTVGLRILPALAGAALIVVFYRFLRELRLGRRVATLGAGLLLLDNAILVESRLILTDSMMLLFGISALTCVLVARRRTGRAHWAYLSAAALLAGMAGSTKWSGLTALGLVGLVVLFGALRRQVPVRRALAQLAVVTVLPVIVYLSSFAVHFALLDRSGPGDGFMSAQFQSTLPGNPTYDPDVRQGLLDRFVELNREMHDADQRLATATHPYSSEWTSWPLMKRDIYYYLGTEENGKNRYIYLLGNPVVWWGTALGMLFAVVAWVWRAALFRPHRWTLALLGTAYLTNYVPFAFIERPMFLYHYFFALLFSLATVTLTLGVLCGWVRDDEDWAPMSKRGQVGYWGILGVALAAFVWFAPVSYGMPLDAGGLDARMWLDSWR